MFCVKNTKEIEKGENLRLFLLKVCKKKSVKIYFREKIFMWICGLYFIEVLGVDKTLDKIGQRNQMWIILLIKEYIGF